MRAEEIKREFDEKGYAIVRGLLSAEETSLLSKIAKADHELRKQAMIREDGEGSEVELTVINDLPEDTIYAAIVRSERMVRPMEALLGGEVYHYHHKMILKEPRVGGAWTWHQDYGYWYDNGCLLPLLASCMIAVDPCTRQNGCLQVLEGSHEMGRIRHTTIGTQTGADPDRTPHALERFKLAHCELEPGDGLFFHCNLLHRSDKNRSPDPRWALICCYNAARNNPVKKHHHPFYSPLEVWPDSRVVEVASGQLSGESGVRPSG